MTSMLRSLVVSVALLAGVSTTASGAPDYGPRDETERGLWQQMDEYERDLKTSEFLMTDFHMNEANSEAAAEHPWAKGNGPARQECPRF